MKIRLLFACVISLINAVSIKADDYDEIPTISPTATYVTEEGEEENSNMSGNAPLLGRFRANPQNVGSYSATYQWRFTLNGESEPYLTRYEEDTEYTFTKAGTHNIVVYATFINGNDTIAYTQEYWDEVGPMSVTISESKLEMPNAFSPNGDGINDIYKAKDGYQSIIEFHAYIFNRWGQKLYEWDDPAGGWDGKYNGKDVKQGVYFVLVKAKGADGRTFNIRRDVNLLRGYSEESGSTATE
ncbi:gliding motility-associated C-terminal domain-containing protein [uncultured Prevotella sp.]|uniref:gliding motility-associated C-terminal domain-containing protein n=1 Tax=uncultured Prevotella sp. TaxID=159272 RepID=UPI0025DE72B4|nr:gliding motility-associated C-terminal domain-containing protein [uncultured Prevotella sp.]